MDVFSSIKIVLKKKNFKNNLNTPAMSRKMTRDALKVISSSTFCGSMKR